MGRNRYHSLVEHRTGIAEVMGSNPLETLIFSGFFFPMNLFTLGGLLPHFRSCDDTLENSSVNFQIVACTLMIIFWMDKRTIL